MFAYISAVNMGTVTKMSNETVQFALIIRASCKKNLQPVLGLASMISVHHMIDPPSCGIFFYRFLPGFDA